MPMPTESDRSALTPGLRERNRIRTHNEILTVMSVLLGERAYPSITVDDVAKQAGVSRGTIYSYFPEGRDQLVRDAYQRIAARVAEAGERGRASAQSTTDRIVALGEALASVSATPEGRFYGSMGPDVFGPLLGRTGSASRLFLSMLNEDLELAAQRGELDPAASPANTAVLLAGSLREIGLAVAAEPSRQAALLHELRLTCDRMLSRGRD